jgi:hypothetical protein
MYGIRDLDRCEILSDVGPAIEEYNRVWNDVRTEN